MRLPMIAVLATLAVTPAFAQQISPMTGTSSGTPALAPSPAGSAPTAPAQHRRKTMQERYDAANTSHDGKLTLEQAKAGNMVRVAEHFDAIDTSRKGYVTVADIRAYNHAQRMAHKAAAARPAR